MEIKLGNNFASMKVAISIGENWGDMVKYGDNPQLETKKKVELDESSLNKYLIKEGHSITV
jgi:hypothetical protein